ncbi:hypothetical protein H2248_002190 [Termitomyces sp. 'cryptogamus']|nr:hypothetical protein H2248_002190 [Termitomyces sp. 'cryptogamus']
MVEALRKNIAAAAGAYYSIMLFQILLLLGPVPRIACNNTFILLVICRSCKTARIILPVNQSKLFTSEATGFFHLSLWINGLARRLDNRPGPPEGWCGVANVLHLSSFH